MLPKCILWKNEVGPSSPPRPHNAAESFRSRTLEVFTEGVHHASKGRGKDGMDTEGRPVSGRSSRSG